MRIFGLFFLFTLFACSPGPEIVKPASDKDAIDAIGSQSAAFSQAFMDGDAATMTAIYTPDGVIFPEKSEYIRGSEAIRRYWTLREGRTITYHKMTPVEVKISGNTASDFGHYEVSGENDGRAWGPTIGKYLVVWERGIDGVWRIHLDMWNSMPDVE